MWNMGDVILGGEGPTVGSQSKDESPVGLGQTRNHPSAVALLQPYLSRGNGWMQDILQFPWTQEHGT